MITVAAEPRNVFAHYEMTPAWGDWIDAYVGLLDPVEALTPGTRFRWRTGRRPLVTTVRNEILKSVPPILYAEQLVVGRVFRGTLTKTHEWNAAGAKTSVRWVLDYRTVGGPIGFAVDHAIAPFLRASLRRTLYGLRRVTDEGKAQ